MEAKLKAKFESLPKWAQSTLELIAELLFLVAMFFFMAFIGYVFLVFFTEGYK